MNIIQRDTAVILRRDNTRNTILFLDNNSLPTVSPERHFWQTCAPVNRAIAEQYNLSVITIRPLMTQFIPIDDETGEFHVLYLMRYQGGTIPDNACWVMLDDLPELASALSISREDLLKLLPDPEQPAWYHYEWLETLYQAVSSITDETPQQIRSWERSAIWRIPTSQDDYYLKLLPEMFAHEAQLTRWLAEQFPRHLPTILPDILPNSLCTADYGQVDLSSVSDLAQWQSAVVTCAQIQIQVIDKMDKLLALGVPQRGLNWLADHLDEFLVDDGHLRLGEHPLNQDEIARVREAIPRLHEEIHILQASSLPETLEHGDLWAGQIILHDNRILITDWSDSAITCPFFSLAFFLTDIEQQFPDEPTARLQLQESYLREWLVI
ncbi:MAG: hypothetical protein AAFV93_21685 [Chloroflexota bacterium]